MALIKCKECGAQISSEAKTCPHCGVKLKGNKLFSVLKYGLFLFLVIFFVNFIVALTHPNSHPINNSVSSASTADDVVIITQSDFERIKDGMSYRQVVDIAGVKGEEISRNHMNGVSGITNDTETVMYSWKNPDGSNMNVMFQNDRMVNKSQFRLPTPHY